MRLKISSKQKLLILAGLTILPALLLSFNTQSRSLINTESAAANLLAFATFGDVPATHPNSEAISYVQSKNIVEGYSDGTFRPDSLINRAEFTKIIIEAYYHGQSTGSNCFPDVGREWFAKYVCFSKNRNFISGYPDGNFKPANYINFVEVAKILVNVKGTAITPDSETWYRPYVEKLAELKAIPETVTHLNQNVTRGEMAEMIYRLIENVTDKPSQNLQSLLAENTTPQQQTNSGLPVRLKIPAINVDAKIENIGLTAQGAVDIPKDPDNAAWYNLSPYPGDTGNAVITGHINWYYGQIGVFVNLHKVKPGDKLIVQDENGAEISFIVRETRSYDAAAEAIDVFISNDGKAHLNLITCGGVWDRSAQQYTERLVVFSDKE